MISIRNLLLPAIAILVFAKSGAQGYRALNGSAFSGSTAVFNNPAAPVNSAYKWDLTLFSVQAKFSSNSAYLFSNSQGTELTMKEGFTSKFMHANVDVSLLNFMYKIDNQKAVSFNIRARTYVHAKFSPFSYADSLNNIHDFLIANQNAPYLQGTITHVGWIEGDLTYSQVLMENSNSKLSGGITLQIIKGASGAYAKINKLTFTENKTSTDTLFGFTGGGGSFAYSSGYDRDFTKSMLMAFGLSAGVEYMTYNSEIITNNTLNYDWKIGASLMDLGANRFKAGDGSGQFLNPVTTISDPAIDKKLNSPGSVKDFRDSLNTLFTTSSAITEDFSISMPTRLILNADKNLGNHFYVNADLSLNFFSTSNYSKLHTRELNLLTITPRWETIAWGVYLPVQYNTQGQLWLGGAVKLGPLTVGFHNFGLLRKSTLVNGGGYILFSVHPFSKRKVLTKLDCFE